MSQKQHDNNRRGALWHAERTTDKSPHYTGDMQIRGEKFRVRFYETGERGSKPALRFYFQNWDEYQAEVEERKAKRGGGQSAPRREQRPAQNLPLDAGMIDDDIPF